MGIMDFSSKKQDSKRDKSQRSKEPSKQLDKDEVMRQVRKEQFLKEYDPRNFEYRGPDPPSVFETNTLEDYWHDKWVDKTGEWKENSGLPELPEKEFVQTECDCGDVVVMPLMSRWERCSKCGRVLINRKWEDSRVENPNTGEAGIEEWL